MMIGTKWRLVFALLAVPVAACNAKTAEQSSGAAGESMASAPVAPLSGSGRSSMEAHPSSTPEAVDLPPEVKAFMERRDLCDHFRGEEPYDQERRAFLDRKLDETCKGTDAALKGIRQKYRDNEAVISALWDYDNAVE